MRRTARLHVVASVAESSPALDRFDLQKQPIARPAGDRSAELAGTSAQDTDQVIKRLPGEIARQLPGQVRRRHSARPVAGLAVRRLLVYTFPRPLGFQRLKAPPKFIWRHWTITIEIVRRRVDQRGNFLRLAFSLSPVGCRSVVGHIRPPGDFLARAGAESTLDQLVSGTLWFVPRLAVIDAGVSDALLRQAKDQIAIQITDGITAVRVTARQPIDIVVSPRALPHTDASYPEWSALWVLQALGHRLGIADHRPTEPVLPTRRPRKARNATSVHPRAIVLFNAHRTHWIDAVPGRPSSVLFAASFDFQNTWPSCCLVERRIRSAIVSLWLDRPRKPRRRRRQPQPVAWSTPYPSHAISARQ